MTALSLLREGSKVTMFFGSRGINAVHKEKVKELKCLPDQPKEEGDAVMKKMEEMELPSVDELFFMLIAEGATVLACPLNVSLFNISKEQLIDGVKVADPAHYYKETVIPAKHRVSHYPTLCSGPPRGQAMASCGMRSYLPLPSRSCFSRRLRHTSPWKRSS
jgi:peroxiredoxin family protein